MKVSLEILEKVEKLVTIEEEADKIRAELYKELSPYFDGCYIDGYSIADEPEGCEQDGGEWCNQYLGYISDSGDGIYYYPVENSEKYLAVAYSF